jgi:hypothetical protein
MKKMKKYSDGLFVVVSKIALILTLIVSTNVVQASPMHDALVERVDFVFPKGDPELSSWDGPGKNPFASFAPYTSGVLYSLGLFDVKKGDIITAHNLTEFAGYTNVFGVVTEGGAFDAMLTSKNPLPNSADHLVTYDSKLTFGLLSPEGLFSSIDANNPHKSPHVLVQVVDKPGTINLKPVNLTGHPGISFDLQMGDLVLYMEDIILKHSDADYNDMVVVARYAEVPEPSTMLLLACGAIGMARRRARA